MDKLLGQDDRAAETTSVVPATRQQERRPLKLSASDWIEGLQFSTRGLLLEKEMRRRVSGTAKLGTAKLGTAKLGTAKLGIAKLGTARLGTAKLARLYTVEPESVI